jgi:hypothetical protein
LKQKIIEELENKKILILGFGKEGRSTYKFIKTNITLCGIATTDIKRRNHPKLNIQVDATTNIQIIDIIMVIIFLLNIFIRLAPFRKFDKVRVKTELKRLVDMQSSIARYFTS